MTYDFLIDTYESECIKVISVWSEFADEDLAVWHPPASMRDEPVARTN